MRLGRQIHRHARPVLFGLFEGLFHQFMPQPPAACRWRSHHATDHYVTALGLWVEQAQVALQRVIFPTHQVAGVAVQVLAIDFLVGALLFDHEHLCTQLQNGIKLLFAQVTVVFANPFNCHLRVL
ncbi:hypothetical protein D3C81_1448630 [compost metagenome]